jgi:hypothetical protein
MPPGPSPSEDEARDARRAKSSSPGKDITTISTSPENVSISDSEPRAKSQEPRAPSGPRLYIVARGDLDPGLLAAQACHVARKFTRHFAAVPVEEDENLLVLAAKDEQELQALLALAGPLGPCSAFHEPDLAGSLTAIALGGDLLGGSAVRRLVSQLPKALGWTQKGTFVRDAAA